MNYGGGGHLFASGARLKNWEEAELLIKDLDEIALKYNSWVVSSFTCKKKTHIV